MDAARKNDEAEYRLDLPQVDEHILLPGPARTALEAALSGAIGSVPVTLPDESTAALMDSLPQDFRNSCDAMLAGWGENVRGKWIVRVLFSSQRAQKTEAVLAFRCAPTSRGLESDYDERPATVSLTPESASLNLIPLAEKCDGCSDLFRLEFSQAFLTVGARLVELAVYHSSDNPCCGGEDEESGTRLVMLDLSQGKQVLALDQRTENDSHDDSEDDGDMEMICDAKITYLRDAVGNLQGLASETQCSQNKKPLAEVKRQNFRWSPEAHKFEQAP